ncbi:MAG TPA: glycosyltransferase [Microthrixaceae bacterium]|nr:glycosyltransferase [Microthrixaceae bacterium]
MKVLGACSLGGAGHLGPLSAVLDAALRRGDDVAVVAPPSMRAMVERAGHRWVGGSEPSEAEIAPIREQLPVVDAATASELGNRELFGRLATNSMLPEMRSAVDGWRPDLIVRDPCEYASAVLAVERDIPVRQVAISRSDIEWGSLDVAAPALDAHLGGLTDAARATPYLTRFPASLDPDRFPRTVRFRDAPARTRPLSDRWGGDDRHLLYATFGTVYGHMSNAVEGFRVLLSAVEHVDARVLLTTGPQVDPSELGPTPTNVVVEQWVDQADVVAAASVVVCHGGSGTTLGALTAGIPLVVVALFADQFANAEMVAGSGAGLAVDRGVDGQRPSLGMGDVTAIRIAAETVLDDGVFTAAARRVADEIASAPTADVALGDRPGDRLG